MPGLPRGKKDQRGIKIETYSNQGYDVLNKYIIKLLAILIITCYAYSQDNILNDNKFLTNDTSFAPIKYEKMDYTNHKWRKYTGSSLLCGGIIATSAGIISLYTLNRYTKEKPKVMTYDETIRDAKNSNLNFLSVIAIIIGSGVTITGSGFLIKYYHNVKESRLAIIPFCLEDQIVIGIKLKW